MVTMIPNESGKWQTRHIVQDQEIPIHEGTGMSAKQYLIDNVLAEDGAYVVSPANEVWIFVDKRWPYCDNPRAAIQDRQWTVVSTIVPEKKEDE
jgi:hypothetical protein